MNTLSSHPSTRSSLLTAGRSRRARRCWTLLEIILAVLSFIAPVGGLFAQNPPRQLPSAQTSELHALLRNEDLRIWQNAAYRLFRENRTEAALHQLQKIFDSADDGFEPRPDGLGFVGIRANMTQLLSDAPQQVRDEYELIHGGEARAVLRTAQRDLDLRKYREVYRRWFHTRAGFEAAHQLAAWHLDHGNPDFAVTLWERILTDPLHVSRFGDTHRTQLMTASRQAGQLQRWEKLVSTAPNDHFLLGGNRIPRADWNEAFTPPPLPETADWLQPLGTPSREIRRQGSAPSTTALYSRPLLDSLRDSHLLTERLEEHHRKNAAIGSGMLPVVVENQLIFRDAQSVRGLDLADGRELWRYPLRVSLREAMNQHNEESDQQLDGIELDRKVLCNSLVGAVSADSERVYLLEGPFPEFELDQGGIQTQSRGGMFRLVALPVDTRNPIPLAQPVAPLWTLGEASAADELSWTFLGPPTPAYGKLLSIAESDGLLYLLEIDPPTGEILEKTPLAVPQKPLRRDYLRTHLACTPSVSRGIAVCPTCSGLLVGVDLTRKTLHWVHSQFGPTESIAGRSSLRRQSHLYGAEGFLNLPMISGNFVFDLPGYSSFLQCIDLQDGSVKWQVDREDALYVAAVHDDALIVVDRQGCRALKVGSGEKIWATPVGPPGGRGVMLGDRFLVPLLNGKVVSLDIRTGRQLGYPAPIQASHGAGHLIPARDLIVSSTATEISVFRQSHSELHQLLTNRQSELAPAERLLRIGELQLRTGDLNAAREALTGAVALAAETPRVKAPAESLLRELLYIDLRANPAHAAATLLALDEISRSPQDRINYLAHLAEYQMRQEDWRGAETTALEIASKPIQVPLTLPGEPQRQVLSRPWAAGLLERLDTLVTRPGQTSTADRFATGQISSHAELARLIQQFARLPLADPLREIHSARLVRQERYQEAEAQLLINRDSPNPTTAAEARRGLIDLWDRRGLYEEAAEALHELGTRFAEVPLRDGTKGSEFYREFPSQRLSAAYARRLIPPDTPVTRVRFSSLLNDVPRKPIGVTSILRSRIRGSQQFVEQRTLDLNGRNVQELALVDSETGQELQRVNLEEQYFPTRPTEVNRNLIHLGGPNSAAALSILDRRVLWKDLTWQGTPVKGLLRAGPAGPDFVVYQAEQSLYVADPVTGKVRWKRDDLESRDGLVSDSYTGIIGDRTCLVVFKSEPGRYRIFDTLDGHEIRSGHLPLSQSYPRVANGRMLFYSQYDRDQKLTIRLWDPLTNRHLFEDKVLAQFSQQSPLFDGGKQFAYVSENRDLKVVRTETGEIRFKIPFPGDDAASAINIFEDRERIFVNIQRSVAQQPPIRRATEVRDLMIPFTPVQGELIAYDRRSAAELWRRQLNPCSVLLLPEFRLPFLVCLSRQVSEQLRPRPEVTLSFLAIDSATGKTLGQAADFPTDHINRLYYEPDLKKIFLWGLKQTWEIDFKPGGLPLDLESEDFARHSLQD